jgi:hypothetical protein
VDRYLYDPKNPPPNWMSFEQMQLFEDVQNFPYDFKDIESRPDVVKYTSPPLEQDLTIAGDVMLVLYASTDVRDTDWWVHLADVDTSGQSVRLTTGVVRARFRDAEDKVHHVFGSNFAHETLLSGDPNEIVRYHQPALDREHVQEGPSHSRRDHERPRQLLVPELEHGEERGDSDGDGSREDGSPPRRRAGQPHRAPGDAESSAGDRRRSNAVRQVAKLRAVQTRALPLALRDRQEAEKR